MNLNIFFLIHISILVYLKLCSLWQEKAFENENTFPGNENFDDNLWQCLSFCIL